MKILVTGGAGFIASHITDKLVEMGHKVVVIDDLSTGKKENLNSKAKFYEADICDAEISEIFKKNKPEIVFHFAAQIDVRKSIQDPASDAKINILGGINVLENCKKFKIKKIIFASSGGAIYGEALSIPTTEGYNALPFSPYGIDKLTIEKYLDYYYKIFNLPFVSLRFANVYGPRQSCKGEAGAVSIFCNKMARNEYPIINGNGRQTRDFVFVDDIVNAAILAMQAKKSDIFNIGTSKETDINTVFRIIKKEGGFSCKEIHGPAKTGEQKRSCLDYSKAKTQLKWQPKYNLEEGLRLTVNWFKNNRK
jgi:UDP-glucose 4-epimerase